MLTFNRYVFMRMRNCETKMAVAAGSSGKLYRFPPTRELRTDYEAVVPATQRRRKHAKELDDYLRRREEETKAGRGKLTPQICSRDWPWLDRGRGREGISSHCATCAYPGRCGV